MADDIPEKFTVQVYSNSPGDFEQVGEETDIEYYDGPLLRAARVRALGFDYLEVRADERCIETDGRGTFFVRLTPGEVLRLYSMARDMLPSTEEP